MDISLDDLTALTLAWDKKWPPPIAHALKHTAPTWVRFHSLPESKRYADDEAEYQILLNRHHQVLRYLGDQVSPTPIASVIVITVDEIISGSLLWRTIEADVYDRTDDAPLYAIRLPLTPKALDPLLRLVADDQIGGVIITDDSATWVYHPYDGGADVIAPTMSVRSTLCERYADWLSTHPMGL
ncbi:hypothetical protein FACS1894185_3890 [Betaproteobacteria bacterium]|nr:hypothetical protein FACS1894185_3890 [Betaproteobacteria bacterium]GHU16249.1 hypothetical protein FACS189441_8320 [Betaproteobacteria bacterium]